MSKKIFGIDPQGRTTVAGSKRNTGFIAEGVDFDKLNQLLFELRADHIIGDATQLSNNDCTCVFQSSDQTFRDSQGALVTFVTGEKIIWAGLDTITASIDISTIDDLTHETLTGVTIALGSQDLDLGENQRGELALSGTGTLTVLSSDGLRVKNSGITIDNQSGDILVDNIFISPVLDFTEDSKGSFSGIEHIIWRIVSSTTGNQDPLGTTWELSDDTENENYLGAGTEVTESSGIFSFATTGYWAIRAYITIRSTALHAQYDFQLESTDDNSVYSPIAVCSLGVFDDGANAVYNAGAVEAMIKVTDIANDKVKLTGTGAATQEGNGDKNYTYIVFSKKASL